MSVRTPQIRMKFISTVSGPGPEVDNKHMMLYLYSFSIYNSPK